MDVVIGAAVVKESLGYQATIKKSSTHLLLIVRDFTKRRQRTGN